MIDPAVHLVSRAATTKILPALLAAAMLTGCGDSDPVTTVVRVIEPRGDVLISLDAAELGAPPDRIAIEWQSVPQEEVRGFIYQVWLGDPNGDSPLPVAGFRLPTDSVVPVPITGNELIAYAAAARVTLLPEDEPPDELPGALLTHEGVRGPDVAALLVPLVGSELGDGPGYAVRAARQSLVLSGHARAAQDSAEAGNATFARTALEHVLNIAALPAMDHDGDGTVTAEDADELGLRALLVHVADTAREGSASATLDSEIREEAARTATAADTAGTRLERLIELTGSAVSAGDEETLRILSDQIDALSDTLVGDPAAEVAGACLLCGTLTAWSRALRAGRIVASPASSFILPEE